MSVLLSALIVILIRDPNPMVTYFVKKFIELNLILMGKVNLVSLQEKIFFLQPALQEVGCEAGPAGQEGSQPV